MTGPSHYGAAEQILEDLAIGKYKYDSARAEALEVALVHGVLALAAATALADGSSLSGTQERDAWRQSIQRREAST